MGSTNLTDQTIRVIHVVDHLSAANVSGWHSRKRIDAV